MSDHGTGSPARLTGVSAVKAPISKTDIGKMSPAKATGSSAGFAGSKPSRNPGRQRPPRRNVNSNRNADEHKRLAVLQPRIVAALRTTGDAVGARNAEDCFRRLTGELRSLRAESRRLNGIVAPLQLKRDRLAARVLSLEHELKAQQRPPCDPQWRHDHGRHLAFSALSGTPPNRTASSPPYR
jgi:hypothetical protein